MQRFPLSILFVLFAFASCKQKTHSDLIVGTWKLSVDKEERKITFYKDLTMQMTSSESMGEKKSGTYKLVHDGKYLDTYEKGRSDTDELEIISINDTTMQLRATKESRLILLTREVVK
jgi:hypothetical protein